MDFQDAYASLERLTQELKKLRERRAGGDLDGVPGVREPNRPRTPPRCGHVAVDRKD
jgi:hypothetical protein